jgi:preprotein translocase subunit SecB
LRDRAPATGLIRRAKPACDEAGIRVTERLLKTAHPERTDLMAEPNPATDAKNSGVVYTITTQYIKDFSFENPRAPHIFATTAGKTPQVQVSIAVTGNQLGDTMFEVVLDLKAEAKHENEIMFVAELSYAGVVVSANPIPREHLRSMIMVEVPRQLFPFARAILSNASRDGGFMPLLLAPVNFEALHQNENAKIDAEVAKLIG